MSQPFRKDSYRNPGGVRRDSGYGYGKGSGKGVVSSQQIPSELARQRFLASLAWAERNVPDEHAAFAASAAMTMRMLGQKVTPEGVKARLREQGRSKEQLDA